MSKPPSQAPASYEAALAELDQLVGQIESGQLPLEQLLTGYQRGAELLKFGQAQALLAGDALQALAFELLVPPASTIPEGVQATLCRLLARAAGHAGMAGGQAIDLASVGQVLDEAQLREMHRRKTGALLE